MKITFHPDSNTQEFIQATKEYQNIWNEDGQEIVKKIEMFSGLKFKENDINSIVFEGISQSHPLSLRASYSKDVKKATLVHELIHRIFVGNNIKVTGSEKISLAVHKLLDLILFDIWVDLYGEEFAIHQVKIESQRTEDYRLAWEYALSFTSEERMKMFKQLTSKK